MTLFDHYLEYMTQLMEGRRTPPEGITLPEGDMTEKAASLSRQLQQMGTAAFVRACARQDGVTLPEEIYRQADDTTSLQQLLQSAVQLAAVQEASPAEEPSETAPDPDAGKHAFEVFLDCVALDDGLVQYLMEVLQKRDWKEFYKLSQITTKLDLDPEEFLYWLGNKELYADEEERSRVLEAAHAQAARDIQDAHGRIQNEQERLRAQAQEQMPQLVDALTRHLVGGDPGSREEK